MIFKSRMTNSSSNVIEQKASSRSLLSSMSLMRTSVISTAVSFGVVNVPRAKRFVEEAASLSFLVVGDDVHSDHSAANVVRITSPSHKHSTKASLPQQVSQSLGLVGRLTQGEIRAAAAAHHVAQARPRSRVSADRFHCTAQFQRRLHQ